MYGFVFLLIWLSLIVVITVGWCKIGQRLGYDPMAGLLMLIPLVGFFVFLYWAFNDSPNEAKLRRLETKVLHMKVGVTKDPDRKAHEFLADFEMRDNTQTDDSFPVDAEFEEEVSDVDLS